MTTWTTPTKNTNIYTTVVKTIIPKTGGGEPIGLLLILTTPGTGGGAAPYTNVSKST